MNLASHRIVERSFLFSPIGLQIRDGFTGGSPIGSVELKLERKLDDGSWMSVDQTPSISSTNVWSFPGLGRRVSFENSPIEFRVRIEAQYYTTTSPIQFTVHAYDDQRPLNSRQYEQVPRRKFLTLNSDYPFATKDPIVRGRIVDSGNYPIEKAKVSFKTNFNATVSTDLRGFFSIPVIGTPKRVWPPNEIFLKEVAVKGKHELVLSSIEGMRSGDAIELQDDFAVVLAEDAEKEQADIVVNHVRGISDSMNLLMQNDALSPLKRRFAIEAVDEESRTLTLKANLPQDIPKGTRILFRSREYLIQSVKTFKSTVTLSRQLGESWSRTARLVRFLPDLEIDIFLDGSTEPRNEPIPVPDGFRFFEIQL